MYRMTRAFLGFTFAQRSICSADDDGKGDDTGGGGGGGDDGKGGGGKVAPEVADFVNRTITGALTNHGKRQAQQFGEMLKTGLAEFAKTLKPGGDDNKADDKTDDKRKGDDKRQQTDPEVLKLKQSLESLQNQLRAKDDENKAIQAKQKRAEERTALASALSKLGVPEARAAGAMALLHTERGAVTRDDDGNIVMKVKRTFQGQTSEEMVPLDEGIAEWAKTEEGKTYLPPANARGSGERGGERPKGKEGEKPTTAAALDTLSRAMMGR